MASAFFDMVAYMEAHNIEYDQLFRDCVPLM